MICPYCGKETPESFSTCNHCGRWLADVDETSTSKSLPPVSKISPDKIPAETNQETAQPASISESFQSQSSVEAAIPSLNPEISLSPQIEPSKQPSKGGLDKYIPWFLGCFMMLCLAASCITLIWAFYSFSTILDFLKTPTPIPTPSPTPSLVFFDDFSNPDSGWPRDNHSDYIDDYYNNAYRMVENIENTTSWVYMDDLFLRDVIIDVEATKNGGPDENDIGLICRYVDDYHFYFGMITCDGYYGIIKMTNDEFSVLGGEYLEYSDAINQGSATNYIRLDCIGDVLTLYVNGEQIDQQTDPDYSEGNVGMIIGTYDIPGADILFDNFSVKNP